MGYDMSRIHERLWVGSNVNSVNDVADIKAAGITHVIDCATGDENALHISGVALLSDPTADDGERKTVKWFQPGIDFGVGALSHPGFTVLCHCAAGVNRGPSMAFAILRAQGWNFLEAIALLQFRRPQTIGGVRYRHDAEAALATLGWVRTSQ